MARAPTSIIPSHPRPHHTHPPTHALAPAPTLQILSLEELLKRKKQQQEEEAKVGGGWQAEQSAAQQQAVLGCCSSGSFVQSGRVGARRLCVNGSQS